MFCRSCGKHLYPDAAFCSHCGAAVATAPPSSSPNSGAAGTSAPASVPASEEPVGWMKLLARLFGAKPEIPDAPVESLSPAPVPLPLPPSTPVAPLPDAAAPPEKLPYRLNNKFLTRAEASFFRVLP